MDQTLLILSLQAKRDGLVARQRARQVAALLGFDFQEQACIAAGVYAIAWQVLSLRAPMELCFTLDQDTFRVFVRPYGKKKYLAAELSLFRLEKCLTGRCKLTRDDLPWAIQQLDQFPTGSLHEEVHRLNQELLATMHALHVCQAELAHLKKEKTNAA